MLPAGTSWDAFFAPLRICSNTGTVGGSNVTPLTRKAEKSLFWSSVLRVGILGSDKNTHDSNVQVDVYIGAAGYGPTGLSDKGFKTRMEYSKNWNDSYNRRRHERLSVETH
jgi:hypothetical protein